MARVHKSTEAAEQAKQSVDALLKGRATLGPLSTPKRSKKATSKRRSIGKVEAERLMHEIDERIESENYDEMRARDYVAFFCWIHEAIYDVPCVDEVRPEWEIASIRAHQMLTEEFGGEHGEFLEYIKHSSKREEEKEIWRRSNQTPGKRLRWRDFFLFKTLLSDYRLFKARNGDTQ